jgi:hypothetical protein
MEENRYRKDITLNPLLYYNTRETARESSQAKAEVPVQLIFLNGKSGIGLPIKDTSVVSAQRTQNNYLVI